MKGLTVLQPWASLIAVGEKKIETRSWSTAYRGLLAIHAGKRFPDAERLLCAREPFFSALYQHNLVTARGYAPNQMLDTTDLPLGAIVAVCELTACQPTNHIYAEGILVGWHNQAGDWQLTSNERAFGDYSRDRFAWLLANLRTLETPIPCKGAQGLWDVPPDIRDAIQRQGIG